MRSRSDPLQRAQHQQKTAWAVGSLAVAACGWFAFGPASRVEVGSGAETSKDVPAAIPPATDPFDAKAFDVALWNPTEARKVASGSVSGAVSRPATRVQLVGITEDQGVLRAALYDPDGDRLWIVGNGESLPGLRVQTLTASEVTLVGNAGTTRLALRRDKP